MQTVTRTSSRDKAKEWRKRIDDHVDALAKAVDDVRASESFKRFLDVQAKFHRYSWHNTMMIFMQKPDASQVAGFNTWKKIGRFVRKGERGIMIFAPMTFQSKDAKGEIELDENGKAVRGMTFRPVHVFDASQTDGEPLPSVDVPTVEAVADDLLGKLARVTERRTIALTFKAIDGGAFGASMKGAIEIDNRHSTGQQAKTLAHELAHEALHWDIKGTFTRSVAELEAEAVAYVVCAHFGLDVQLRSSRYIALWDGDSKGLRGSLDRIAKTAREIIDDAEAVANQKAVA